jgi:hypothetical protein
VDVPDRALEEARVLPSSRRALAPRSAGHPAARSHPQGLCVLFRDHYILQE